MKQITAIVALFAFGSPLFSQTFPEDFYFPIIVDDVEVIQSEEQDFSVETVVEGLDIPWGIAFLPDGSILITERPGSLRIVRDGELQDDPIAGVPEVVASGQGGLLDIKLHPEYEDNGWIYITYSNPGQGGANTALVRARLEDNSLVDQEILFEAAPFTNRGQHFGSRIAFDHDGYVFFSIGDRGEMDNSQDLSVHAGSIIRLHDDGEIPADNPFVDDEHARSEIYSYGHRNPQGLIFHPETGLLWSNEHGPRGGDEINIVQKGLNYGWPLVTYGTNYDGSIITEETERPDLEPAVHTWVPSIAPSGLVLVSGDRYPGWEGNLFTSALAFQLINRNVIEDNSVIHEERLLTGIGRIRNIHMGPDGLLYLLDESAGSVLRLIPQE